MGLKIVEGLKRIVFTHKLLIFIILLVPWFFIGGPGYEGSRSFKEAWNLGHVLFFATITVVVDRHTDLCRRPAVFRIVVFLLAIVGVAYGIEVLQTMAPDREASLQDILLGLAGGVLVLVWKGAGRLRGRGRIILRGCGAGIVLICVLPLLLVVYDEFSAWRDFPVLGDFESALELSRWENDNNSNNLSSWLALLSRGPELNSVPG